MWCIHTNDDGRFRFATSGPLTVTSVDAWLHADTAAAQQWQVPDDNDRTVQLKFMHATGLTANVGAVITHEGA